MASAANRLENVGLANQHKDILTVTVDGKVAKITRAQLEEFNQELGISRSTIKNTPIEKLYVPDHVARLFVEDQKEAANPAATAATSTLPAEETTVLDHLVGCNQELGTPSRIKVIVQEYLEGL